MVLVKINTPVHYHVKKYRICKNKICQIPGTFFDGNMVVSAGMAHMTNSLHFSEWRNCMRAQRKVNLCAPGAPKGPKVGMFVRQYEIVCANDAGRAPRKYPGSLT